MAPQNTKPKATAAFKAMRKLGVPPETITKNLKKLLDLYDKNWSLIEEDNYRVLADVIFQSQEEEETQNLKELYFEAPLSVSPSLEPSGGGGGGYVLEEDEAEFGCFLPQDGPVKQKGKLLVSGRFGSREEGISGSKRPSDEWGNAQFKVPKSVVYPSASAPIITQGNLKTASIKNSSASDVVIASTEGGEVKISIHLPHFCMPNLDSVFKMVEEKCMKTYNITDPDFCLKNLMKELCESCLEAGNETAKDAKGLVNEILVPDSFKKSCVDVTSDNMLIRSGNGKVPNTWYKNSSALR
ncbi:hypothetical protein C5167_029389 [Papaver somniferum]|uniref:uncharacterized protein LOC113344839 n=1 Tax=Papaver somniferum TaxID=3469 RepID=UPI000E705821|nr:uncharacterized protein LOC113344839 [Papaver somniferum]RZC93748.1 hypothetical protein C5167_029389 [Papaver somniferum]